jgi:hypothetical protein
LYHIIKTKRSKHTRSENWQPVSLYDSEDYFRGQAIFEIEKEAKLYMKKYNGRVTNRNNSTKPNNPDKKIKIALKIFAEDEKPQISYPFYYIRRRT